MMILKHFATLITNHNIILTQIVKEEESMSSKNTVGATKQGQVTTPSVCIQYFCTKMYAARGCDVKLL